MPQYIILFYNIYFFPKCILQNLLTKLQKCYQVDISPPAMCDWCMV